MGGNPYKNGWLFLGIFFFFLKFHGFVHHTFPSIPDFQKYGDLVYATNHPALFHHACFFVFLFSFFSFFSKCERKKILPGAKTPSQLFGGERGGEGEGEGDTSSPPSPIKPLYISVYVRRCSPKCQFIVLCYICMYICMYMRTIKNVRQHKIRICIKGIQPESFDQETIRGAPRAAATVVTRGYYLSKSTYIWNKCAILPAWLAFWSCTGNFFFLVCTTWLRGFVRTYDPFLTTYMRMEALPSPGSSRLLECSWSWKYSFAQVGEA